MREWNGIYSILWVDIHDFYFFSSILFQANWASAQTLPVEKQCSVLLSVLYKSDHRMFALPQFVHSSLLPPSLSFNFVYMFSFHSILSNQAEHNGCPNRLMWKFIEWIVVRDKVLAKPKDSCFSFASLLIPYEAWGALTYTCIYLEIWEQTVGPPPKNIIT